MMYKREQTSEDKNYRTFRIICLKRSEFSGSKYEYISDWYKASKIVYWKANYSGYTEEIKNAGLYRIDEISKINGKFLDWFLEPTWM